MKIGDSMKINVICVGKIKEKYFTMAIDEYFKRLGKYVKLSIIEVDDEKAPDNLSPKDELIIKKKEGVRILKKIKTDFVVSLDINGKTFDSVEFSNFFVSNMTNGVSSISFIIGGSIGLYDEVLKASNLLLSFSPMTFPHQLMRVILLEQIYRSFRIIGGEPYHK